MAILLYKVVCHIHNILVPLEMYKKIGDVFNSYFSHSITIRWISLILPTVRRFLVDTLVMQQLF